MSNSVANTTISGITEATGRTGSGPTGQGGRRTGQGGRGRGGRSVNSTRTQQTARTTTPRRTNFKGDTEGMNGNVFECFEEQSNRMQFIETCEALEAYAKKTMDHPEDMAALFDEDIDEPTVEVFEDLPADAGETAKAIWNAELREYVRRKVTFKGNLAALHAVIFGQCSLAMKDRLKTLPDYKVEIKKNDCAWLLKNIRAITQQFYAKRNGYISIMGAQRSFLNCRQGADQEPAAYLATLRTWAATITQYGGSIAANPRLITEAGLTDEERLAKACEKTLAIALITGASPTRYGTLITQLANEYAMGRDQYPEDMTTAYNLLVNYVIPVNTSAPNRTAPTTGRIAPPAAPPAPTVSASSGITFAQAAAAGDPPVPGNNGGIFPAVDCYVCGSLGHYAANCPTSTSSATGTTLTQYAFMMAQAASSTIDPAWILLDSQSTISVFNNPSMLTDIKHSGHTLRALTNGGHQDSVMTGVFPNLGTVWFNPSSIANILSLAEVRKVCRVTLDTSAEPALCVHRRNGSIMKFVEHASGLYVFDTATCNVSSDLVASYTMVSTVAEQKKMFSARDIAAADSARELYRKLGRPSDAEFYSILTKNFIRNCPVTPDDARRASHIYGPDVASLKGKMTRSAAAPRTPTFEAIPLPAPITAHYRKVTLCVDFFCPRNRFLPHHLPEYRFPHRQRRCRSHSCDNCPRTCRRYQPLQFPRAACFRHSC